MPYGNQTMPTHQKVVNFANDVLTPLGPTPTHSDDILVYLECVNMYIFEITFLVSRYLEILYIKDKSLFLEISIALSR